MTIGAVVSKSVSSCPVKQEQFYFLYFSQYDAYKKIQK